jgi:hypothetical protein
MPFFDGICWAFGKCNFYNTTMSAANYEYNCSSKYNNINTLYTYLEGTPSQFNMSSSTNGAATAAAGAGALLALLLALVQALLL